MNKRYNEIIKDYADSIKTEIKDYDLIEGEGSDSPRGTFVLTNVSIEEGSDCPVPGCTGELTIRQTNCYCSTMSNPPCYGCENSWLECTECGMLIDD